MALLDINGTALRSGQHVAWATVEMGHLATGLVQHVARNTVAVVLDSNGRKLHIPWNPRKFVVLSYEARLDLDHRESVEAFPETAPAPPGFVRDEENGHWIPDAGRV